MRRIVRIGVRFTVGLGFLVTSAANAQPFTYEYFPSNTTISSAYTTDFQVVGFSGGRYNEDTFAREFTGPSSPTVTIADGAVIPDAEVFNSSVVNATGGAWSALMYDTSTLNVLSGANGVGSSALGFESSTINVYDGRMFGVYGQNRRINVFGGSIRELESNTNTDYLGNSLGVGCITDVLGGTFIVGGNITAFNDGILNLRGGLVQSDFIRAAEGGTLNIFGTDLVAALLNPNGANGYSIYSLSGFLADGSPLNNVEMRIRNDGETYGHSTFNLISVPGPGVPGVLAVGAVLAARRRRN